ncbi:SLC13 family permease [Salinisphaera sp. USBA-960]|uniref:SLC13 family permease n=1 Tax=Salinisphaera orenii TaxID=856731 RepID=UPI000DBE5C39|nr:SLC13 family permease [Salifodinibacter halophilus]NNC26986.1 SLC13 family permease [Salifodinibacter halophilus]
MTLSAWFTLAVLLATLTLLATTSIATDVALAAALLILLLTGIITPAQAFSGFSNPGVITIAALFIVVAGLQDTGVTQMLASRLLRRPRSLRHAQFQIMPPATLLSAFVNNTPVVAALIPAINNWCRRHGLPASQLMMPLSFAAILGGTCTLIGTSGNLLVNALMIEQGLGGLGMFELAWIGVPVAIAGLVFIIWAAKWLLPSRGAAITEFDNPREYSVEMQVEPDGPLPGKTIAQAGLRRLPGMFMAEIERDGHILPAVSPTQPLQADDRLLFVGIVDSVVDLQKLRGLTPANDQVHELEAPKRQRVLVEAVVSDICPLNGQTVRESNFRSRYNAAVLAVARNGERLHRKIGDIQLQAGDTLLLETRPSFIQQQRHSRDFFLVSQIENSTPPEHHKSALALAVVAAMVVVVTLGLLPILKASLAAAAGMLLLRCCTITSARRALDWPLFIAIAAALGLGAAVRETGLAAMLAEGFLTLAGTQAYAAMAVIYTCTVLISAVVTNNAAVVIMFPIAASMAASLGASVTPFAITVIMGASASFMTPIGYQTNLMVYGPGGYRFGDFTRLGLPLTVLVGTVSVVLIPLIWPLGG